MAEKKPAAETWEMESWSLWTVEKRRTRFLPTS